MDDADYVVAGPFLDAEGALERDARDRVRTGLVLKVNGPLRYRVRISAGLNNATRMTSPVLESPILDDVVLSWRHAESPAFSDWRYTE